jgi:hypothetical protein
MALVRHEAPGSTVHAWLGGLSLAGTTTLGAVAVASAAVLGGALVAAAAGAATLCQWADLPDGPEVAVEPVQNETGLFG